jgi:nucleoside-diphosphate-sugar epimerase
MKVLITGSSGFLGNEFTQLLNKKKYHCFFLTRGKQKKNYFNCPLQNHKKLKKILKIIKPDIIINLAAEVDFQKKTINMYNVNAKPLKIFSEYCTKERKHLIQSSGTLVNGSQKYYSRKTSLVPNNDYGKSKLLADNFIINSKCKYTILRFGGIYGKNGPHHLGINKFINNAVKGKKLEFKGNPGSKRNYVYVGDAAKTIKKCLDKKIYGIFYIGGEIQTFKKMMKKINSKLGKNKNVIFKKSNEPISNQIILNDKIIKPTSFSKSLNLIR